MNDTDEKVLSQIDQRLRWDGDLLPDDQIETLKELQSEALDAAASFHLTLIEIESLLGSSSPGGALK